jgi:hypothetical protein
LGKSWVSFDEVVRPSPLLLSPANRGNGGRAEDAPLMNRDDGTSSAMRCGGESTATARAAHFFSVEALFLELVSKTGGGAIVTTALPPLSAVTLVVRPGPLYPKPGEVTKTAAT